MADLRQRLLSKQASGGTPSGGIPSQQRADGLTQAAAQTHSTLPAGLSVQSDAMISELRQRAEELEKELGAARKSADEDRMTHQKEAEELASERRCLAELQKQVESLVLDKTRAKVDWELPIWRNHIHQRIDENHIELQQFPVSKKSGI